MDFWNRVVALEIPLLRIHLGKKVLLSLKNGTKYKEESAMP